MPENLSTDATDVRAADTGIKSPGMVKCFMKYMLMAFCFVGLCALASWTFWLPHINSDLSKKLNIVTTAELNDLHQKTVQLQEDIDTLKNQPTLSLITSLAEKLAALDHKLSQTIDTHPTLTVVDATVRYDLMAALGYTLLKNRLHHEKPFKDILPLLRQGFSDDDPAHKAIDVLTTYADEGVISHAKCQAVYETVKNNLTKPTEVNDTTQDWFDSLGDTLKSWIHIEKNISSNKETARNMKDSSQNSNIFNVVVLQNFLKDKDPKDPSIHLLTAYANCTLALQTLEIILLEKLTSAS